MKENKRKRVIYVFTSCRKSGPVQVMYNLIGNLDKNCFEPVIITIYKEQEDSELDKFKALGITHHCCPLGKIDIIRGNTKVLYNLISELHPYVIHTTGVFPDYAISKMNFGCQLLTLHNYMHDDYLSEFGPVQGRILEALQMYAVHRAKKVITCSKSLSDIYKERNGLVFDFISNGIDTGAYHRVTVEEKKELRRKLDLPPDKTILVYSGRFVPRKNQQFVLQVFASGLLPETVYLLLLGSGPDLKPLREKYGQLTNVDFRGMVTNVNEYLQCADLYISASKSEGLPNGVLEAMATGLPVALSDIPQHKEIFTRCQDIGELYCQNNVQSLADKIKAVLAKDINELGLNAEWCAKQNYDAKIMSKRYQELYSSM